MSQNDTKASQQLDIPTKIAKLTFNMFCEILHPEFNKAIELPQFPSSMEMADILLVYKTAVCENFAQFVESI